MPTVTTASPRPTARPVTRKRPRAVPVGAPAAGRRSACRCARRRRGRETSHPRPSGYGRRRRRPGGEQVARGAGSRTRRRVYDRGACDHAVMRPAASTFAGRSRRWPRPRSISRSTPTTSESRSPARRGGGRAAVGQSCRGIPGPCASSRRSPLHGPARRNRSFALIDSTGRVYGYARADLRVGERDQGDAAGGLPARRRTGRPSAEERGLLGPMITVSDNERADAAYYRVGEGPPRAWPGGRDTHQFAVGRYWGNARFTLPRPGQLFLR